MLGGELTNINNVLWDEIIAEFDENSDGLISFIEFCKVMSKFAECSLSLS